MAAGEHRAIAAQLSVHESLNAELDPPHHPPSEVVRVQDPPAAPTRVEECLAEASATAATVTSQESGVHSEGTPLPPAVSRQYSRHPFAASTATDVSVEEALTRPLACPRLHDALTPALGVAADSLGKHRINGQAAVRPCDQYGHHSWDTADDDQKARKRKTSGSESSLFTKVKSFVKADRKSSRVRRVSQILADDKNCGEE